MVTGKAYSPTSKILFKLFRLPFLFKNYLKIKMGGVSSLSIEKRHLKLIKGSNGYHIVKPGSSLPIWVTWPEKFSSPASLISDLDGYWAVDIERISTRESKYNLYWLYPFDFNVHVWMLNASGERVGYRELDALSRYRFFWNRLGESQSFAVRLYALCDLWGDDKTCRLLKKYVLDAAKDGDSEAIYVVLASSRGFLKEELRICIEKAIKNIDDICIGAVSIKNPKVEGVTLEKLVQSVTKYESLFDFFSSLDIQERINYFQAFRNFSLLNIRQSLNKTSIHVHENISDEICLGLNFNIQSIAVIGEPELSRLRFHILNSTDATRVRVTSSAAYTNYLISLCERNKEGEFESKIFDKSWILDLEVGDLPGRNQCVAFERAVGDNNIGLIPDLYYFSSRGFRSGWIDRPVPPWTSKATLFTWRGVTSGAHDHTVENISTLPRVRLCDLAHKMGPLADVGISNIVHARSPSDAKEIENYLKSINIYRGRMPQHIMGRSKFLLEIDGYANSWGFLAKLLMGCCVLKVDSPFEQWFYPDLKPWLHYIPVAQDLSNLFETMEWCLANQAACRDIASAGMAFAEERTFDREMTAAAATLASFARPLA